MNSLKQMIQQLEEQLTSSIMQQQKLKSQNHILKQQLKKITEISKLTSQKQHPNKGLSLKKKAITEKYEKMLEAVEKKIAIFNNTIKKYEKFLEDIGNRESIKCGNEKGNDNEQITHTFRKSSNNKRRNDSRVVYKEIQCVYCGSIFTPCQYFTHLRDSSLCAQAGCSEGSYRLK